MKLTKSQLKQVIKEEFENILKEAPYGSFGPPGPDNPNYEFDDDDKGEESWSPERLGHPTQALGFDPALDKLEDMFEEVAVEVIHEYKKLKGFDKEIARKEIIMVLQASLDGFIKGGVSLEGAPPSIDLDYILDDLFHGETP